MKVLVTGAAGFIGYSLAKRLIEAGHTVVGLDNINAYYDPRLKYARLSQLGIMQEDIRDGILTKSTQSTEMSFIKLDLTDPTGLTKLFEKERFDCVVNLAGQAGIRYSIDNPYAYIQSNIVGFLNILECCRHYPLLCHKIHPTRIPKRWNKSLLRMVQGVQQFELFTYLTMPKAQPHQHVPSAFREAY